MVAETGSVLGALRTTRAFAGFAILVCSVGIAVAGEAQGQQEADLRIVVLEGEDSVNIVEQGTAVPTLVEVRDRNDLPVSGASVLFALSGGDAAAATLNAGLSQVAATTNALGQAAVTVNPIARGLVQLQVSTAFQGQTAVATIVQTNFATVAEAAVAGATAAGGGAAAAGGSGASAAGGGGAGGGLGPGAIGGIVGGGVAAAVGAVVATRAEPCAFSLSETSFRVDGNGGTLSLVVRAEPEGCSPAEWTASSQASFITVDPASGSGTQTVRLVVGRNGARSRTGTVTIAGMTVTVSQEAIAAPCDDRVRPGGDTPERHRIGLGRFSGRFDFSYDTAYQQDRMVVRYEGNILFDTGCVGTGGSRRRTLRFSGDSSVVIVRVHPNCRGGSGTWWEFQVSCARP